jgi:hypothetical protein
MAKIVRYNGNLQAFASAAPGTERTIFGETTQANDLTSQITADFLRGWGIVGPSDSPALEDFNGAMYTHGQLLAYLHQMGVAEYNAAQEYHLGSLTQTGGILYISKVNNNTGNTPASSPTQWDPFGTQVPDASTTVKGIVELATNAETQAGTDAVRAVTPAGLASRVASTTAQGLVELADNTETQTGSDATRAVTPAGLSSRTATESRSGVIAIATQGGVTVGTDDAAAITPLKLATRLQSVVQLPYGFISGFALSNNATTPGTVIDVGPGSCSSAAASVMIYSNAVISGTLQSSGGWAAGSGNNKLDTGARAPSTWYHVFAIRKTSDGSADILFSLSATSPTMPTGYAGSRRIGSFKTDSGGPITTFTMDIFSGRRIYRWGTPIMDVSGASLGTTASNYTMSAPPGVNVRVELNTFAYANNALVYFSCPDEANLLPANTTGYPGFTCGFGVVTDSAMDAGALQLSIKTNTSAQIRARANVTVTLSVLNLGWEE